LYDVAVALPDGGLDVDLLAVELHPHGVAGMRVTVPIEPFTQRGGSGIAEMSLRRNITCAPP
jgi:hypothetical protein